MKLKLFTPKQAARNLVRYRPQAAEYNCFKHNLTHLLSRINEMEREENQKNCIRDFLRDTFYAQYEINTKDTKDLVIHNGKTHDTPVAVIIEAKRPGNHAEMMTTDQPNVKALHELVLYYMNERFGDKENISIKYCIATNIYEWYIIDASFFENNFARNKAFLTEYIAWKTGKKVTKDTNLFYNQIAKPFIEAHITEMPCIYFDIRDQQHALQNPELDTDLLALYKVLSHWQLLHVPFINDSNALNEQFYKELLHLLGLEEKNEGGKTIIKRKEKPDQGSILENAINILETENPIHKIRNISIYGDSKTDRIFNIALELSLTWINRILFLKLLEGQLVNYHKGDRDDRGDRSYRFLNTETLQDFNELYRLFHYVLLKPHHERTKSIQEKYSHIPYLNSSLFEISQLEDETIKINQLSNTENLDLISTSILKDKGKPNSYKTLDYLFKFLDCYDFSSEGANHPTLSTNRTLINASVLGKVFEKINGYKDGSVFTPGYITMYMCRQAIRPAVIQKFKDKYKWEINEFGDLKNYIADRRTKKDILLFNQLINSLHICDPAVGSGHFLVSALNEMIAIKAELGIFADEDGMRLSEYEIGIVDDELIITDSRGELFTYQINHGRPLTNKLQLLQKTLFHEKQKIIENCLFGVDINPNSVQICRLRLWIELLKNAYYNEDTDFVELETLPNLDINIKSGNSLLSRFPIDADLSKALKSIKYSIKEYRGFVEDYKKVRNRDEKRGLQTIIDSIKADFKTYVSQDSKEQKRLNKKSEELNNKYYSTDKLFNQKLTPAQKKDKENLEKEVAQLIQTIDEIKQSTIYRNAFEWRFEFPEVLNDKGEFEGFDIVIGNPPYGVSIKDRLRDAIIRQLNKVPDYEIYYFFINVAKALLKPNGIKSYIIPNTILFNVFAKNYRENLFNEWQIQELLDCTNINVFEGSATVRCVVTLLINKESDNTIFYRPTNNVTDFEELISRDFSVTTKDILLANNQNWALVFKLNTKIINTITKIKQDKNPLKYYFPDISQGLIAYDKYQGQDEYTIKNRIYHSTINKEGWQKWLWGEDITPYSVKWNGKEYIDYCKGIANPREPKFFIGERLLIREITNPKIYVGYTAEESYNDPSIIIILKNKQGEIDVKVLLAILNSKLATFYHFNTSPKATKGLFPKILVDDVKNFPLPTVVPALQQSILKIVSNLLKNK